ncbi:hypothetical protein, variant 1 [Aphanomyces astaci]|uniref:Uncharacterized protein n=1 Tax=Aphanomyces astaci TaxID=112090 RepID=W4H2N1_APHAT|nr:hypothetical protein, variant 1 [Aphanomyces astaci]ETV85861.1 hypothetical protein, variant 1 [Aphanomyces astaci]|eukprot:XP_009824335.1 hypothetical protein, variant 1 [Aphanomyces astaci]
MAAISIARDSDALENATRHAHGTDERHDNEANTSDQSRSPNSPFADRTSVSSPATSSSTGGGVPPRLMRARTRSSSSVSIKSGGDDDMDDADDGNRSDSSIVSAPAATATTLAKKPYVMGTAESNGLRRTVKVVVQRTTDVEQRLPQMVHKIGVIVETPRHPNTWFRVRFRSGKIHTFRASGLKPLKEAQADGDNVDLSEIPDDQDLGPPSDDDHESGSAPPPPPPPPPSDDTSRFEKHDKVTIKLVDPTKRELSDLRVHNGKDGVVQEVLAQGGYKVALSGAGTRKDESTVILVKQAKHLRRSNADDGAANNVDSHDESGATAMSDDEDEVTPSKAIPANDIDEGSDGDNEEEEEPADEEPSRPRKAKKKESGSLLSDLDTDLWIGRRVRINVGKFSGQAALVLKSGNGWVQLKMEGGHEATAKRAYELTLLETLSAIQLAPPSTAAASDNKSEPDNDVDMEEDAEDSGSEHGRVAGSGLRRRGHYAQSWIERKVYLPGNHGTGIVKKADRDVCTVEVENASKSIKVFKKQELVLIEDDFTITQHRHHRRPNKAATKLNLPDGVVLMGITTQRYTLFQDQVKKHVTRRRDKIKMRPNLMEWQSTLDTRLHTSVAADDLADVIDLFVLPSCALCGVEKQEPDGACWNVQCPRCPVFDAGKCRLGRRHCMMHCSRCGQRSAWVQQTTPQTIDRPVCVVESSNPRCRRILLLDGSTPRARNHHVESTTGCCRLTQTQTKRLPVFDCRCRRQGRGAATPITCTTRPSRS